MIKLIITIIGILTLAFSCDNVAMDRVYPIKFINNFTDSVEFYFIKPGGGKLYPDTTLEFEKPSLLSVPPGETRRVYLSVDYYDFFKELPSDTLSVFVIHFDTLNKYTWEEIRDNYMILKRYDLSLDNLIQNKYTIIYP